MSRGEGGGVSALSGGRHFPETPVDGFSPTKGGMTQSAALKNSLVSVWIGPCDNTKGSSSKRFMNVD